MDGLKDTINYLLRVNEDRGVGFRDADIDSHLRMFCEAFQRQLNKNWVDVDWDISHKHDASNGILHSYDVVTDGSGAYVLKEQHENYSGVFGKDAGCKFLLHAAIIPVNDAVKSVAFYDVMRRLLKTEKEVANSLKQLLNEKVWNTDIASTLVSNCLYIVA